jgi:hypothetical protein
MSEHRETVDVTNSPELQDLVRAVRERGEPMVLRSGDEELALLVPIHGRNGTATEPTPARNRDRWKAELLALAGAWSDIDADKMIDDIYRARHAGVPDESEDE